MTAMKRIVTTSEAYEFLREPENLAFLRRLRARDEGLAKTMRKRVTRPAESVDEIAEETWQFTSAFLGTKLARPETVASQGHR